jgi:N-acetyl-anhydromuramyl-L-alanine amidase AmpD
MINIENPPFIPAKHFRKGRIRPVEVIVLHSMESPERRDTAENVAKYFQRGPVVASAHYCVDDNSIVQCVWDRDTAFHCKNANANGVGIEHAGYARQTTAEWLDEYGQAMLDLSAQLGAYLCRKFDIQPLRAVFAGPDNPKVLQGGFCGHYDVPGHGSHHDPYRELPNRTIDTTSFPWSHYLDLVARYLND